MADTKKYLDLTGLTTLVNGIKNGDLVAGKAANDVSGRSITETYATKAEIEALDAVRQVGDDAQGHQQIITGIEQKDGKLFALSAATLDGADITYTLGTDETGPLSAATTVDQALKTLAAKASAQELAAADKSVVIGTDGGKTTVKVNIKSGEKVITLDTDNGIYTDIKLSAITPSSTTVKEEYALIASDGTTKLGSSIKIYKDSSLVSITLEDHDDQEHVGQFLKYTYIDASGATQSTYVNVSAFLVENEFASGVTANNAGVVHGVVDSSSEKVITGYGTGAEGADVTADVLTVGGNGFKVNNIQAAIDAKIGTLDVTDTAEAGKYISQVSETDGKISVSRADVSGAVLNNYSKGNNGEAVAATDTLNQAISKIENQVDKAKAAATTEVVEGTDNDHIAVTSGTSETDGHTIYTITATDVASESALTAEITARKAIDGQNGQTYAANSGANYISAAESLNDADVKLDTALKSEADRAKSAETAIDGAVGLTKDTNETRTWTPTTNYSGASATVKANMQAIDTQVKANEDAITILNADSGTTGSVKKAIADLDTKITGNASDTVDSLTLNGLKKKIEAAAAAATTVVAKKEGEVHLSVSATTDNSTSATTYTIETVDVASDSATTTEFNNIEGAVGLKADGTYSALTGNYVSASTVTSIAKAIEALDAVIGTKNDTAAQSGDTVYGKIQGTWERVRGTQTEGDPETAVPTLWSLKKDITDVATQAAAAHTKVVPKDSGHVTVTVVDSADTTGGTTYKKVTIAENDIASAALVGTLPADASTTYSASTVVQYAKNYTDVQIDALNDSFVAITTSEIEDLF